MVRLDKFLCDCGVGTRSQVKTILKSGQITVDGITVRDGSVKLEPTAQQVCMCGELLLCAGRVVAMLNKPAGYITATQDPDDHTVMELLPPQLRKLKPVGRLDKQTEGLLLFTDDGELLHQLISPKKEVPKVYYARHEGTATERDVKAFADGLTLRDGTICRSAVLEPLGEGGSLITVCEGKYHQVRRMMASRGMTVLYLERRAEGTLTLGDLPRGEVRILSEDEIRSLEK